MSVTRGRNFAYCIAIVSWNVLECIQQMAARTWAVDWRKNELHSCSTGRERLVFLLHFSERDFLHSGPCKLIIGIWKDFAVYFLSSDAQWEDLSNSVSTVVLALVVVEILPFESEGQLGAFKHKGLINHVVSPVHVDVLGRNAVPEIFTNLLTKESARERSRERERERERVGGGGGGGGGRGGETLEYQFRRLFKLLYFFFKLRNRISS